ncbi:hypothetical protein ACTHP2_06835 [Bacillus altitudinis]|uniref:response regulator aspartate phosphatase n=1 Tax=Bacillus altitudinis TaxID=293387 RepID=UPI0035E0CEC5
MNKDNRHYFLWFSPFARGFLRFVFGVEKIHKICHYREKRGADGESTFISCRLINEWYYHIQRFNVLDVEAYKEEIKSMLDNIVHFNDSIRAFQDK